jgi:predicted DNA-binding transcriptional regulator AlpA
MRKLTASKTDSLTEEISLREREAARLLGMRVATLQRWRFYGTGPPFLRINGRSIRYVQRELLAWRDSQPRGGMGQRADGVRYQGGKQV